MLDGSPSFPTKNRSGSHSNILEYQKKVHIPPIDTVKEQKKTKKMTDAGIEPAIS
jgi:hypothetical protein